MSWNKSLKKKQKKIEEPFWHETSNKGHRTKKHYINDVKEKLALEEIKEINGTKKI